MATLKMCKNCRKVVEVKKTTKFENGCDITIYECPECGHIETQSINTVHYGNDGLK